MWTSPLISLGFSFLSPAMAAAGVACVAVPIIIHLLTRQRRTPIAWGAMKFLLEAYKKHRRRLTLEQMLLLACRCLVVLLVGMALARPILDDASGGQGPVHLYLLLDNSLASQLRETSAGAKEPGTALDRFKEEARALLATLDPTRGDRAGIVTLAGPAEGLVSPPSPDLGAVGRVLGDVRLQESRADLAGAIGRLRAELADAKGGAPDDAAPAATSGPRPRIVVAVLSDLRAGSVDLTQPLASLAGVNGGEPLVTALPAALDASLAAIDNIAVVSVEPLRPLILADAADASGGEGAMNPAGNQVKVTLRRFGPGVSKSGSTNVRVGLCDAKSISAPPLDEQGSVRWQPGEETGSVIVDVRSPAAAGVDSLALVARIDADALPGDDICVRCVQGRRGVRVAVVESLKMSTVSTAGASIDRFSPGDWIRLLLQPDAASGPLGGRSMSGLAPTTIDPASVGRSGLAGFDAAIVLAPDELNAEGWRRLSEFSAAGGLVVVTPPADLTVHVWGDAFAQAMGLDWSISREVEAFKAPMQLAPEAPGGTANPLLGLLSGEMAALAKPVNVFKHLTVKGSDGSLTPVLSLADGSVLVAASMGRAGSTGSGLNSGEKAGTAASNAGASAAALPGGMVVLLTAAINLEWTDLPTKPLMLPLLHEMVRVGVGRSQPTFDHIAGAPVRSPPGASELLPADERAQEAGRMSAASGWTARSAGVWRAVNTQGATLTMLAVNPDTRASDTAVISAAQASTLLAGIAGSERIAGIGNATSGAGEAASALKADPRDREPISIPLLASALGLALLEVFLARRFSHATRAGDAGAAGRTPA